jgi:hypothetical protein
MSPLSKSFIFIPGLLAMLLIGGCETDGIPTTPSAPFNLTRLSITRNVTPATNTVLAKNQSVTFNVEVAYTVGAPEDSNLTALTVSLDFDMIRFGTVNPDSVYFIQEIGSVPDFSQQVTKSSSLETHALAITTPNPPTGTTRFVRILALITSGNRILGGEVNYWPLQ